MNPTGVIVRMEHIRKARMCSSGTRKFFSRHGMDWPTFLRDGLDSSVFRATGDAMAIQVAELAEAEHGR